MIKKAYDRFSRARRMSLRVHLSFLCEDAYKGEGSMKFSEIYEEPWKELQPYLDTCVLPISGLTGAEAPWEAGSQLEKARDVLDAIEAAYTGRVVIYPAVQYWQAADKPAFEQYVEMICTKLKQSGFRYVVLALGDSLLFPLECPSSDLIVHPEKLEEGVLEIPNLWNKKE